MNRLATLPLLIALAGALLMMPAAAQAEQQVYWTHRSLLQSFFPASERVTFRKLELEGAARERLARRLGYVPARPSYTIFVASSGAHLDGYAIIDEEMGQHEPITFGVKLSPAGVVERHEIMVYRESRGDEVRSERFRRQFVGKSTRDPIRLHLDIDAVSGATISSASMTVGVRRAVALLDELLRSSPKLASAGSAPAAAP